MESPTPSLTAKNTSAASPKPRSTASGRWAFIRSTRLSSDATPSSMITKRKSTMMAPAYTMICTANRKGLPRTRKNTARQKKFTIKKSAEWTALRASSMASAAATATGANTQNTT